jgi:hypothetical protein
MEARGDGEATVRAIETQKRYYDLRAPDYLTGAPSDRGPGTLDGGLAASERRALLDELSPTGDLLELACGPGGFTRELARHASSSTKATRPRCAPASKGKPVNGRHRSGTRRVRVVLAPALAHTGPHEDRAVDNDEVRVLDGVPVARRALGDGREFDVIKVFWNADELAARLRALDWDVTVRRVGAGLLSGITVDASA